MTSADQARPGIRTLGLLAAGAILLTGCASSHSSSDAPPKSPVTSGAMTPGMVMPDGSTMGAAAPASPAAAAAKPSAPAAMICSAEVRSDIATVLAVKQVPRGTSTFVDGLFTCRYALPMGPLVISVQESPDSAATTGYFKKLRQQLGQAADVADLAGLGEAAYGTNDTVVLRKDHDVLRVDASGLPAQFGAQHAKRADFAYEIASDILGCWTGDDGS
jgi:hypothetical protein